MSINPIAGYDILIWPQYIEESTPGQFPDAGTMNFIAPQAAIEHDADLNHLLIPGLGSRDVRDILRSLEGYGFTLRFYPINIDFLNYAVDLTLQKTKTLSLAAKVEMEDGTKYWKVSWAKPDSLMLTWAVGAPVTAEMYFLCRKPVYGDSVGPTLASDPGTEPLQWYSGGDNPFSIGATTAKIQSFMVRIDNNLRAIYAGGSKEFIALKPGERRITGRLTVLWRKTEEWDLLTGDQYFDITWTLDSGVGKQMMISDAKLTRIRRFRWEPTGDAITEIYDFFAKSAALT